MTAPTYTFFRLSDYLRKIEDGSLAARQLTSSRLEDVIFPDSVYDVNEAGRTWFHTEELDEKMGELDEIDLSIFSRLDDRCSPQIVLYKIGRITGTDNDKTPVTFTQCDIDHIGDGARVYAINHATVDTIGGDCRIDAIFHSKVRQIGENAKIGEWHLGIHRCDIRTITDNAKIYRLEGGKTDTICGKAFILELRNPSVEEIACAKRNIKEYQKYEGEKFWDDCLAEWAGVIAKGIEPMSVRQIKDNAKIGYIFEHVTIDEIADTVKIKEDCR